MPARRKSYSASVRWGMACVPGLPPQEASSSSVSESPGQAPVATSGIALLSLAWRGGCLLRSPERVTRRLSCSQSSGFVAARTARSTLKDPSLPSPRIGEADVTVKDARLGKREVEEDENASVVEGSRRSG